MIEKQVSWGERLRAGAVHVLFSTFLLLLAMVLVYVHWYPAPLAKATGVQQIFWLLLGVDLVLGPIMTVAVFKRHRVKWLFNLSIILVLQSVAFIYGLSVIEEGRPAWLVFVVDDFELVAPAGIDLRAKDRIAREYQGSWLYGPRFVAAYYSDDPKEAQMQREEEIFEGISLAQRPETYTRLSARSKDLLARAKPLSVLSNFNDSVRVEEALRPYPLAINWLPLKGGEVDMVVLLDAGARVLAVVDLRPWG